jgi:hypothetical protein
VIATHLSHTSQLPSLPPTRCSTSRDVPRKRSAMMCVRACVLRVMISLTCRSAFGSLSVCTVRWNASRCRCLRS